MKQKKSLTKVSDIIARLKPLGSERNKAGMARFGIESGKAFGVSMPNVRSIAKEIPRDNKIAQSLWETGIHEAQIMATIIADPKTIDDLTINSWIKDLNSWDTCDQLCGNLIIEKESLYPHVFVWANSDKEFVKRTAFSTIAYIAVHRKDLADEFFNQYYDLIIKASVDERNFVKKAVNWALRQIGKRNENLRTKAISIAEKIAKFDSKSAKWIAQNAIKELKGYKFKK